MNQKGVTLIELTLSIVLIGIIAYAVTNTFVYSSRSVLTANSARDATQMGRLAMDRMVREIRNVQSNRCISAATNRTFTFVDGDNNTIGFNWSGVAGAALIRTLNGTPNTMLDQVNNLVLTYYKNDATVVGTPVTCGTPCSPTCGATDLWSVNIDLTTQSGAQTVALRSQVHPGSF